MRTPAIRNSWTRLAMRRIRSLPDAERLRLLEQIPRTTQNECARAKSDAWLPAIHAIRICDALAEVLGNEGAAKFWRDIVYDSWVGGLLGPLIDDLRGEGETDEEETKTNVLALAPAAWSLSARDCGELALVDDTSGRLRLEARNLPPEVRDSPGIQLMYAGGLKAILDFSHVSADVEVDTESPGALAYSLTLRE